jgi:peptide/nickel transport system ATP-binding protein
MPSADFWTHMSSLEAGPILEVRDLRVGFESDHSRTVPALRGINLEIRSGQIVGLVGKSGSGKSVMALSILGLLPPRAKVLGGQVLLHGVDLLRMPESRLQRYRGRHLSLVPQDPMTALNPGLTIGAQMLAAIRSHQRLNRRDARAAAARLLLRVHLPDPDTALRRYPHELSGGQRQRVVIALALVGEPQLLIADEATTALDVTHQARILNLFREQNEERNLTVLLITHDLGVVAQSCSYVYVIESGVIHEHGPVRDVLGRPQHPATIALLNSFPDPRRRGMPLGRVAPATSDSRDPTGANYPQPSRGRELG